MRHNHLRRRLFFKEHATALIAVPAFLVGVGGSLLLAYLGVGRQVFLGLVWLVTAYFYADATSNLIAARRARNEAGRYLMYAKKEAK